MVQELGLDGQAGVLPLSDRFAEMGGIPVNDDGGEQVKPGHAVVLAGIGCELSQQLARRKGAAGQGGSNPQDVRQVPQDHVLPDYVDGQSN